MIHTRFAWPADDVALWCLWCRTVIRAASRRRTTVVTAEIGSFGSAVRDHLPLVAVLPAWPVDRDLCLVFLLVCQAPYTGGAVDAEDLLREKDACGVGFVANTKARASLCASEGSLSRGAQQNAHLPGFMLLDAVSSL